MANPNIVNVTTITGKTALVKLSDSLSDLVTNSAGSNKVYKVNSIIVSNASTSSAQTLTLEVNRSSVGYSLATGISVPLGSTIVVIAKDSSIYLEEGDKIQGKGSTTNALHFTASYEEIS